MPAIDLSKVGAGFNDPVHDSQQVFRNSLQALSHPGEIVELTIHKEILKHTQPSAAALLLALLDADSRLWATPAIAESDTAHWIVFHTNCKLVTNPAEADFAWIESMEDLPELSSFNQGTDEYPELSTTCLINVTGFESDIDAQQNFTLQGPGIPETRQLSLGSVSITQLNHFHSQWRANKLLFPKGVDVFLCSPNQIAGLPRTVHLSQTESTPFNKG